MAVFRADSWQHGAAFLRFTSLAPANLPFLLVVNYVYRVVAVCLHGGECVAKRAALWAETGRMEL